MAQDITLLGASYTGVPAVELPKTGGGTAKFADPSGTTAVVSDVASGKKFLLADGTEATGTASGGGTTVEALNVTANGTYTAPSGTAYSPVTVNVPGGGGGVSAGQVNFVDADGSIVQSYSAAEALALESLPSNPTKTGLTAQGWNWSLADIKSYLTDYPGGVVNVGQMYITDDGKTRIYIHLGEERKSPMLGVCPNGTVDVDWGDGTAHDTLTGTSLSTIRWTPTHNYASGGDYVIKLTVTGTMAIVGSSTGHQYCQLLHHGSGVDPRNNYYISAINRVEIGSGVTSIGNYAFYSCRSLTSLTIPDNVTSVGTNAFQTCSSLTSLTIPDGVTSIGTNAFQTCFSLTSLTIPDGVTRIGNYAFYNCYSLTSLTIPDSVTSIGAYAFQNCYGLTSLTIPDGVTSIGNYAFQGCSSLTSLTIPDGVTSIGNYAFQNCYSLTSLTIPDSVTSIGTYAFYNCYGIAGYHLLPTTPPTLANTSTFNGIVADCVIYVPAGCLEAYQTATNWSTYASYMQEEPT